MSLLWGVATVRYCVELDWTASAYCSIWILLTAEVIYELWQFLLSLLVGAGGGRWPMACPWREAMQKWQTVDQLPEQYRV